MKYISLIIYIILQIICLPLSIIGFFMVLYKQLYVSKKLGVSSTAIEVINGRWTMAKFGLRKDTASVKLNKVLPNSSVLGLWLCLLPLYIAYKLTGQNRVYPVLAKPGKESLMDMILSRTIFIDKIIAKYKHEALQFVVLGAGFDTRCYGDLTQTKLKFFELDQTKTQRLKRQYLKKAGINSDHVHFVEVNFSHRNWFESLIQAGFDPNQQTLFLWEGVTLYLSEKDVRNTLNTLKTKASKNSVLIVDIYSKSFVTGNYSKLLKKSQTALTLTDEGLGFGLDFSGDYKAKLKSFVKSQNLVLDDYYFLGYNTPKGPYMVVAEIML